MNTTSRRYTSQRKIAWTYRTDLSDGARQVAQAIDDLTPTMHPECWCGNERIAALLKRSLAWVQSKLRELELKGLITRVADYALATRRRIVLLWRKPAEPITPEPEEEHMNHAPVVASEPARVAPDERHEGEQDAPKAEGRKATPEEVASLVRQAAKLGNPSRRWVLDVARKYGYRNVAKAVDRAVETGKRRFGWVLSAVEAWAQNGMPEWLVSDDDRRAESAAQAYEVFGPGGEYEWKPKPSEFPPAVVPIRVADERRPLDAWLHSGNPALRRIAEQAIRGGVR